MSDVPPQSGPSYITFHVNNGAENFPYSDLPASYHPPSRLEFAVTLSFHSVLKEKRPTQLSEIPLNQKCLKSVAPVLLPRKKTESFDFSLPSLPPIYPELEDFS